MSWRRKLSMDNDGSRRLSVRNKQLTSKVLGLAWSWHRSLSKTNLPVSYWRRPFRLFPVDHRWSLHRERHLAWQRIPRTKQEILLLANEDWRRDDLTTRKHVREHTMKKPWWERFEILQSNLRENGCTDVPVFVIDSYKLTKFDFEKFEQQLIENFSKLQKSVLILSLQMTNNREKLYLKVTELRSCMWLWQVAALSAAVASTPLPDHLWLSTFPLWQMKPSFTTDETSLICFAELTSTDYLQYTCNLLYIFYTIIYHYWWIKILNTSWIVVWVAGFVDKKTSGQWLEYSCLTMEILSWHLQQ